MRKLTAKQIDKLIEAVYYRVASGIQIDVLDIGKVFAAGRAGYLTPEGIEPAVVAIVAKLRKN